MTIHLRPLTEEEQDKIERLGHSRTAPARKVERAQIVWQAQQGRTIPAIAQHLHVHAKTVRDWLQRFSENGFAGLDDRPRSGKPPTYTPEQHAHVIAASLTNPQELGLPFACRTLDRLVVYLSEDKSLAIKRSRVSKLLI